MYIYKKLNIILTFIPYICSQIIKAIWFTTSKTGFDFL